MMRAAEEINGGREEGNVRGRVESCGFSSRKGLTYKRLGEGGRPLWARQRQEEEGHRGWATANEDSG